MRSLLALVMSLFRAAALLAPALQSRPLKLLYTFKGHTESVGSLAFSPDGKMLASGTEDGTITMWDVN